MKQTYTNCIRLIVALLTLSQLTQAQSSTQNHILTRTYTGTETYLDQIQYFDGLGRPVETVQKGFTPTGYDLSSKLEYDNYGREAKSWLPSPNNNTNGAYTGTSTAASQYADSHPYSEVIYENSPLDRPLNTFGPGKVWRDNSRSLKTEYLANVSAGDQSCGFYQLSGENIIPKGSYSPGELHALKITDEDNNVSYEFTNKRGQLLLQRKIYNGKYYDTYYLYDDIGNLRYALSPMASDLTGETNTTYSLSSPGIDKYAYAYRYNQRNLCIEKKLPGIGWTYLVYDKADRLRMTQDPEQRTRNQWTYYKYDELGRPVTSGTIIRNASRTQMQNLVDATIMHESLSSATDGNYFLYSNNSFPRSSDVTAMKELTANYYDSYSFLYPSAPIASACNYTTGVSDPEHASAKGLLTGTRSALLDESGKYTYKHIRYDQRHQPVQIKATNTIPGEMDYEFYKYNYTGQVIEKNIRMKSATVSEKYTYAYDKTGRLTTVNYALNSEPSKTIATYAYDQFARVASKNTANLNNTSFNYNIRGWQTKQSGSKFTEELFYTSCPRAGHPTQFEGNIIARQWKTAESASPKGMVYVYDALDRLTNSSCADGTNWNECNNYAEHLTYDKNGNFQQIIRNGRFDNNTYGALDVMIPQYNGNQLLKIIDYGNDQLKSDVMEHKDIWDQPYTYDPNGRITADPYKEITNIEYNSLHLPRRISMKSGEKVEHTYNSQGTKMQTKYIYHDGTSSTVDYIGNKTFQNNKLIRVINQEGYYEPGFGTYYYIRDYLGNNRLVIDSKGTIVQATNYYASGISYAENPPRSDQHEQPYKFNGKLLNKNFSLDLYDYQARIYNPAISRFTTMDPLAEKYYSISPYAYCGNNPVKYTDPTGKWIVGTDGKPVTYSSKNGFSENASKDVQRVGNAMMKTETGTTQLNKLFDHSSEISINISDKIIKTEDGLMKFGSADPSGAKIENGKINVEKFSITVYEEAIKSDIKDGGVDYGNLSLDEAIGAVGTHESGHTDAKNVKQMYDNAINGTNHDVEKVPMELENKYIEELKNKTP